MIDLKDKRITVTGGKGFLGRALRDNLERGRHCRRVASADLPEYDLRTAAGIDRMYADQKPEIVIHLAALVGGIGANQASPGRFFYENAIMGIHLLHEAFRNQVEKFVALGTICCYPKLTPVPFREENLWDGYPEETNAPYGLAKKMLLVQSQAYRRQYGFHSIFLMPVNLYGPGDNFDPGSSHVIPALIRKFLEAREEGRDQVVVWGTGKASREFLFVEDAAEGIALACERYDKEDPVNLGAGFEITIRDLAERIAELVGYTGSIVWDASRPDGQPRRRLDVSRAKAEFGFVARTGFESGLRRTIDWYRGAEKR
ncbi:MAG: GDP-L-fucose synthase [Candidatus Aminicenantes bacterium]|nr:GDP-L-fucose synthase [Candidatus Aminicenantes bacterium]